MKIALTILFLTGMVLAAGEPRPAAELLADLDSSNYQLRRKAVLAVEGRSEPELFEKILVMAEEDHDPNIRSYCADVLGTFTDDRIHPLLVAMTKDKWPGPRSSAYVALGRQGKPESYDVLVAGLDDPSCRGYAAKGLGLLKDVRAWDSILGVWGANPRDGYLVDLAPLALFALDADRAIALFLTRFEDDEFGRHIFTRVFREHPTPAIRTRMTGLLKSNDQGVRQAAIRVLGKAGNEETVDLLIAAIGERETDELVLARALAELGARKAARPIAGILGRTADPVAKVTLFGVLADLGDPRAVAAIAGSLDDDTHSGQPPHISAIWGFPHNVTVYAAATWAIRTLLDGEEPYARSSLSSFPNPPAVDPHGKKHLALKAWWEKHREEPGYRFE